MDPILNSNYHMVNILPVGSTKPKRSIKSKYLNGLRNFIFLCFKSVKLSLTILTTFGLV